MIETTVLYQKKVLSLVEVLQPFTSKFTTGDVSTSLFLDARWQERRKGYSYQDYK